MLKDLIEMKTTDFHDVLQHSQGIQDFPMRCVSLGVGMKIGGGSIITSVMNLIKIKSKSRNSVLRFVLESSQAWARWYPIAGNGEPSEFFKSNQELLALGVAFPPQFQSYKQGDIISFTDSRYEQMIQYQISYDHPQEIKKNQQNNEYYQSVEESQNKQNNDELCTRDIHLKTREDKLIQHQLLLDQRNKLLKAELIRVQNMESIRTKQEQVDLSNQIKASNDHKNEREFNGNIVEQQKKNTQQREQETQTPHQSQNENILKAKQQNKREDSFEQSYEILSVEFASINEKYIYQQSVLMEAKQALKDPKNQKLLQRIDALESSNMKLNMDLRHERDLHQDFEQQIQYLTRNNLFSESKQQKAVLANQTKIDKILKREAILKEELIKSQAKCIELQGQIDLTALEKVESEQQGEIDQEKITILEKQNDSAIEKLKSFIIEPQQRVQQKLQSIQNELHESKQKYEGTIMAMKLEHQETVVRLQAQTSMLENENNHVKSQIKQSQNEFNTIALNKDQIQLQHQILSSEHQKMKQDNLKQTSQINQKMDPAKVNLSKLHQSRSRTSIMEQIK